MKDILVKMKDINPDKKRTCISIVFGFLLALSLFSGIVCADTLTIRPNAAGATNQWTAVGCTDVWDCVNETTQNGDTDYVNVSSDGQDQFFNLEDHTTEIGEITNVRVIIWAKNEFPGDEDVKICVNSSIYCSPVQSLTTSYAEYYYDWAEDPNGGAWTWSDIDVLQAGVRSTIDGTWEGPVDVTQLYVEVTYYPPEEIYASGPGYVMVYQWTAGAPEDCLRVAISTDRANYTLKDVVNVRIRTDGYFTQDCGWWYTVSGTVNEVNITYPNGTVATTLSGSTDEQGVWEEEQGLKLRTTMPPGTYSITGKVTGLGREISSSNFTVNFTVIGLLNASAYANTTEIPRLENVTITAQVNSTNGNAVEGATVLAKIILPNETIETINMPNTNSTGGSNATYNCTDVGRYYVVVVASHSDYINGTARTNFSVTGVWPYEAPSAFGGYKGSAIKVILMILLAYLLVGRSASARKDQKMGWWK